MLTKKPTLPIVSEKQHIPRQILEKPTTPNLARLEANMVHQSRTTAQLQQYLHSIMGALPVKTYLAAIKAQNISSFPGLLEGAVLKGLPATIQTKMGHLNMIWKGICPTPGMKTAEINELMDSVIELDIEMEQHEMPLDRKKK